MDQDVAGLADALVQAYALGTEHERDRAIEALVVDRDARVRIEADDAQALRAKDVERSRKTLHRAELSVLDGSRAGAKRRGRERRRTVLWPNDRARSERNGASNDGAEVLGIFDRVENDHHGYCGEIELV